MFFVFVFVNLPQLSRGGASHSRSSHKYIMLQLGRCHRLEGMILVPNNNGGGGHYQDRQDCGRQPRACRCGTPWFQPTEERERNDYNLSQCISTARAPLACQLPVAALAAPR